jgi:hypothetical protein
MKTPVLLFVLLCFSVASFGGEVRNSTLGKLSEESSQQHQDAIVAHTQKYTEKLIKIINEVIAMRKEAEAMGLNPYMCYDIEDEDAKISCSVSIMAGVSGHESYCYEIKDTDDKNDCIAGTKNDISYCYSIKDEDTRSGCIAGVEQKIEYCYSIKNQDTRSGCIAGVEQNVDYCYSIKNQDARYGCLAGFPMYK